jgi:hypothetical protein
VSLSADVMRRKQLRRVHRPQSPPSGMIALKVEKLSGDPRRAKAFEARQEGKAITALLLDSFEDDARQ